MPAKKPPAIHQTALGQGNVQVAGDYNTVNVNQTFIQRVINDWRGETEQQRARRNRHAMLELVRNMWIKGVLDKSLYNEVLIELGMEERPRAVDHPWDMQLQMPNRTDRVLPPGTSMIDVFDEMNGAMLILGEPGSGKTTMLLELARDCIARAQQDDNHPIPVVFNLSSWEPKQALDDWLVNELRAKYYLGQKLAQSWVENDDLQLFLDGLDEVKPENRNACVDAINDFRQKRGLAVPIVVCSRITDYGALTKKLKLSGAVLLQALTPEQIDEYFERAGSGFEGVHQILKNDEALQELVKQPLILSIITLAYQGKAAETIENNSSVTVATRRRHLFNTYIQRMFERVARTKSELYPPEQTKRWLAWLAQKLIEHNAIPFLFENMQPEWLSQKRQKDYRLLTGLFLGLVGGLVGGPVVAVVVIPNYGPGGALRVGLLFGLCVVLMIALIARLTARLKLKVDGFAGIEMVDTVVWDWKKGRTWLFGGMLLGLFVGLLAALMGELRSGLIVGLLFGLMGAPYGGLTVKQISQTAYPGQRIYLSMRTYLSISLLFGLIYGVISTLIYAVVMARLIEISVITLDRQTDIWLPVLLGGLVSGLAFGIMPTQKFGLFPVIQHFTLRLIIARDNLLPQKLVPFLDYCVDHIFLHRVGGGYIFIHRLLMEHFAAMYREKKEAG